ncbi:MAG: carboxymuconolactone decarboxylase family protein [Gammaproteobacteria bacterium]|nr:carboxymuconolactone decarboxylase family protein [Gammaproteobacteria bacterium]
MNDQRPAWYRTLSTRHAGYITALEQLGEATRAAGPIEEKTAQLLQLVAAAAVRSEGAVHSHVRRSLDCGASPGEIRHALILATSLIGFPTVSAALRWAEDILEIQQDFHLVGE